MKSLFSISLLLASSAAFATPAAFDAATFDAATLQRMRTAVLAGSSIDAIETMASTSLRDAGFEPDYAVIRRATDLGFPGEERTGLIGLVAARLGSTRLIDNLLLDP